VSDVERLSGLVERALGGDPAAADELVTIGGAAELARSAGGELPFRLACAELAYVLGHVDRFDDEQPRERYSALVDEHGGDPARLAVLRPLGERLRALEESGVLPRAMVMRSRRRSE